MGEKLSNLKIAIVHDWIVGQGGGERVLYDFHLIFPDAPIYTLVYNPEKAPAWCRDCDIRTTYIQKWPGGKTHHKLLLKFMPKAWEALDLTEFDVVLSSSMSCCKGVITKPDAVHVCFCHSPIRYVWDLYYEYLNDADAIKKFFMRRWIHEIRMWDFLAAQRVDYFISNSDYVGRRIKKYYKRDSVTIHPSTPIKSTCVEDAQGYYLIVSRFVGYKRVDLAIEACNKLGRKLKIIGSGGEEEKRLRSIAGPTIEFLGRVTDEEMAAVYAGANAFLFPGVEDFGMTPIEAMSSGVPVLAYGEGGALETVVGGESGLFFKKQTADSLADCILEFEAKGVRLSRQEIADYAQKFAPEIFRENILSFLEEVVG